MEERIDPADVHVEGPESDSQPLFPVVGVDRTPTAEDIAAGRFGNGAWNLTDDSVQVAYQQRHRQIQADRDERRNFFNEEAKDALADAIKLHHKIVKRGLEVMEKLEKGETPSRADMAILTMAQKSGKEIADRGMGRATAAQQDTHTESILTMIANKPNA